MNAISFPDLPALASHLRHELQTKKFILLYAYMGEETKGYFRKILREFLARYPFNPALFPPAQGTPPAEADA